jgi:hypothetical protein
MNMSEAISNVKNDLRLREWEAQIKEMQASGLSVRKWCEANGIKRKTFYYRLRKVRENCLGNLDSEQKIVPLCIPETHNGISIELEKGDLRISLPKDISTDTLLAVVNALC